MQRLKRYPRVSKIQLFLNFIADVQKEKAEKLINEIVKDKHGFSSINWTNIQLYHMGIQKSYYLDRKNRMMDILDINDEQYRLWIYPKKFKAKMLKDWKIQDKNISYIYIFKDR